MIVKDFHDFVNRAVKKTALSAVFNGFRFKLLGC